MLTRCSGRLFPGNHTGRALAAWVTVRDACEQAIEVSAIFVVIPDRQWRPCTNTHDANSMLGAPPPQLIWSPAASHLRTAGAGLGHQAGASQRRLGHESGRHGCNCFATR